MTQGPAQAEGSEGDPEKQGAIGRQEILRRRRESGSLGRGVQQRRRVTSRSPQSIDKCQLSSQAALDACPGVPASHWGTQPVSSSLCTSSVCNRPFVPASPLHLSPGGACVGVPTASPGTA